MANTIIKLSEKDGLATYAKVVGTINPNHVPMMYVEDDETGNQKSWWGDAVADMESLYPVVPDEEDWNHYATQLLELSGSMPVLLEDFDDDAADEVLYGDSAGEVRVLNLSPYLPDERYETLAVIAIYEQPVQ